MRLDLFLKASRLIVRRTLAQQFCDAGRVRVNGAQAKSSKEIKIGDEIEIRRGSRRTTIRVVEIPNTKQVSKASAGSLFETIADESIERDLLA